MQYTFTHKQYIENKNETQYPERNIHKKECINITIKIYNLQNLPFGPGIIFLFLAHPVYKMLIIQEPNTIEL